MTALVLALAQISWSAPEDGGTPRDPGRIRRQGEREFLVLARAEEGASALRHAVSRMDLVCANAGARTESVVLRIDLSGDGTRQKLDPLGFGGVPTRDYVYVQEPGRPWVRVDGVVEGWICTVRLEVPPGELRVGLSPWYGYGDCRRFIDGLPGQPALSKSVAGRSDGGRELWELTITDPSVPAEGKERLFWHAREHGYETFSSFAMEGLVRWLLSEEAVEVRKRFAVTLHPMTNVDGAAGGFEYRAGYDYPEPRASAVAKLTWGTVDRLRPDFVVSWHNWIAPRNLDVVFYTDAEDGKASRRAWDLFTQRFPSPRSVGHRWSGEAAPLRYNWHGRRLSEDNVHQYAMKRYGSRVWGWEMPWWGRDREDPAEQARRHGADFGRAFFAVLPLLARPSEPEADPVEVGLGHAHGFLLRGTAHPRGAAVVGDFESPSGRRVEVEAVREGEGIWRLAFAPDEAGEWSYRIRGEGIDVSVRGRLIAR